ncbi:MAG: hypothetical protein NZ853_03055 [Leptospiraceae bacterium]|nr:hypothetical protein [Leptospiraceae bacterium]MDW7975153.1 hypothetical protein [Leptospiraceae bacterium]
MKTLKPLNFLILLVFIITSFCKEKEKEASSHAHHHHHHHSGVVEEIKDFILCDVHKEICHFTIQDEKKQTFIEGKLNLSPKPVYTMKEIQFQLEFTKSNIHQPEILLDLTMPAMYMGENKVIMKKVSDNLFEGKGIFPECTSDDRRWNIKILMKTPEKEYVKNIQFDILQ